MEDTRQNRDDLVKLIDLVVKTLSPPGAWIKGALAKTRTGRRVDPTNPRARSWCVSGAIGMVAREHMSEFTDMVGLAAIKATIERLLRINEPMTTWNDHTNMTQCEVTNQLNTLRFMLSRTSPTVGGTL